MEIKVKDLIAILSRFDGEINVRVDNDFRFISGFSLYNRSLLISTSEYAEDAISIKTEIQTVNKEYNHIEEF